MAKILIVDDSGYTRKMIADVLKTEGFNELLEASSGEEALKIFDAEKPDLVLLDIILTGLDGLSVLKEIKNKSPGTKVIIVSAIGQDSYRQDAEKSGTDGYLVKPFSPNEIIEKVKEILK